ncbi:arylesterase [Pseudoalteromonas sp. SS15]|uniref:arylesterase n=1 Tax=Pseudoalteromonas sp. SS15 TaxID=3139393 RepID=UPI003BAA260C
MQFLKILSLLFIFFLTGCSDAPKLTRLQQHDVILAFGDSLTQGVGVSKQHSYPSVLESLSGVKVINAGVSGETTNEGLNRFADVIEQHAPSIVILLEGGNDILQNKNLDETQANLNDMIGIAQSYGVEVVLIGVPQKSLFSSSAPLYQALADKHHIVFEPSLIAKLMKKPSMKSDYIHFNRAGYAAMAESIHQLLKDNGAL